MKVRIKVGAPVSQDFSFFRWQEEYSDVVFDAEPLQNGVWNMGRYKLRANGFGELGQGNYGNGAVFTDIKNLMVVDKEGEAIRMSGPRTVIFDVV